jgi:hypothetical protein
MCLCILEEDRQDEGKVTALVAREEQKREQNKIYTRLTSLYF